MLPQVNCTSALTRSSQTGCQVLRSHVEASTSGTLTFGDGFILCFLVVIALMSLSAACKEGKRCPRLIRTHQVEKRGIHTPLTWHQLALTMNTNTPRAAELQGSCKEICLAFRRAETLHMATTMAQPWRRVVGTAKTVPTTASKSSRRPDPSPFAGADGGCWT